MNSESKVGMKSVRQHHEPQKPSRCGKSSPSPQASRREKDKVAASRPKDGARLALVRGVENERPFGCWVSSRSTLWTPHRVDTKLRRERKFRSPGIAWRCIGCRNADRRLESGRCRTACHICHSAKVRPAAARACTRDRQSLRGGGAWRRGPTPGL